MEASPSHSKTRNLPPTRSASNPDFASASATIQNHSSILNNPSSSAYSNSPWSLWPSSASSAGDISSAPPITQPSFLPDVPRSDFAPYLALISEPYSRFEDIINHSLNETTNLEDSALGGGGQGEALVACLREVPSLFFKEDFVLEDGATFKSACLFSPSEDENLALQERLTQYLDTVEMHLVREIALRSDSFFEAQRQLQGLDGEIVEACVRIRELKEGIRVLTGDLVGSAKQAQELNAARGNLVGLQQKLTVILYVSQALSALKLLVVAADCAGALDVIDDLQHFLDYKVHRDEIHTKLVQIMRERLLVNLRKLPQIVETWKASEDNDLHPSQFARHVTKEVTYLHRILSQILLEADVHAIFRQVVQIFHSLISEAFSKLDVNTPRARNRLRHDVQHILGCIRKLPSDNSSKNDVPNYGLLDEFLAERFAPEEAH